MADSGKEFLRFLAVIDIHGVRDLCRLSGHHKKTINNMFRHNSYRPRLETVVDLYDFFTVRIDARVPKEARRYCALWVCRWIAGVAKENDGLKPDRFEERREKLKRAKALKLMLKDLKTRG